MSTESERVTRVEILQQVNADHIKELFMKHEALTIEVIQGRKEIITSLDDLKTYFHTHMEKRDKKFGDTNSVTYVSKLEMVEYIEKHTASKVDAFTRKIRLELGLVITITLTILAIVSDVIGPIGGALLETVTSK